MHTIYSMIELCKTTKVCIQCKNELALEMFSKCGNGKRPECKECYKLRYGHTHNERSRKCRANDPLYKEKQRLYGTIRLMSEYETIKNRAHSKMHYALRSGAITRPSNCSSCSKELELEGHLNDYNKPLEVTWLCKLCHKELHSGK